MWVSVQLRFIEVNFLPSFRPIKPNKQYTSKIQGRNRPRTDIPSPNRETRIEEGIMIPSKYIPVKEMP